MTASAQFQLPDGRIVSYATYGPAEADPVVVLHGLVGSVVSDGLDGTLAAYPLRFVYPARPGYGTSTPFEMDRVLDWALLLEPFLDTVVGDEFDVLAFSAGAPYAYSLAHAYPDRVGHVYVNGGLPALHLPDVLPLYGEHAPAFYEFVTAAGDNEIADTLDRLFFHPLSAEALATVDVADARANGLAGMVREAKLQAIDWGFDLATIAPPVTLVHVATDSQVPLAAIERTATHLPDPHLVVIDHGDHCDDHSIAVTLDLIVDPHRSRRAPPAGPDTSS